MVTKLTISNVSKIKSFVLAKKLMVTKPLEDDNLISLCFVLAKKLMVTKRIILSVWVNWSFVLAKKLMVTKPTVIFLLK